MPLDHYVRWFDTPRHRERLAPDYLARLPELSAGVAAHREAITEELRASGYWRHR